MLLDMRSVKQIYATYPQNMANSHFLHFAEIQPFLPNRAKTLMFRLVWFGVATR
ncbi:MAG: hypothetical protein OXT03_00205 [Alphaproteobacteria bacterium]|nr:hypothetical protein [Alphaproteobacteria bacterium]